MLSFLAEQPFISNSLVRMRLSFLPLSKKQLIKTPTRRTQVLLPVKRCELGIWKKRMSLIITKYLSCKFKFLSPLYERCCCARRVVSLGVHPSATGRLAGFLTMMSYSNSLSGDLSCFFIFARSCYPHFEWSSILISKMAWSSFLSWKERWGRAWMRRFRLIYLLNLLFMLLQGWLVTLLLCGVGVHTGSRQHLDAKAIVLNQSP